MDLILNELSAPRAASAEECRDLLESLCRTSLAAIENGCSRSLLFPQAFLTLELGNEYTIFAWLTDSAVELELKQALQSLSSWTTFLDDFVIEEAADIEVALDGQAGLGLTLAHVRDHVIAPAEK